MRPPRPHLLGLVCWVLILANTRGIYTTMKQMGNPVFTSMWHIYPYPAWVAVTILFGTMAICVISAICMYEGQGWARFIYLAVMVPYFVQNALAVSIAHESLQILAGKLLLFVASIVILFLPNVRRFFHPPVYVDE
jgi:hypothetical protein